MSLPGVEHWIRTGDLRRAASWLVVTHGPDVLATCLAMLRDRTAAEDVTQEVFSDAMRALSTFRGDSSPRTWLLSIARNRCIDYLRARRRDPWGGALDESAPDPDEHADEGAYGTEWFADRSVVLRALDALGEGDRALIVLRFKNGLEYDELASAFGLRAGTVRMRVSRALARMRQVLESSERAEGVARPMPPTAQRAPLPPPPLARPGAAPALARAPEGTRARALPGAPAASYGGSLGAPPSGAPPSWWARLKAWALGSTTEPPVPPGAPSPPVGTLGLALSGCQPSEPSEALAARLAQLVESTCAGSR